ncbi:hypothetical protein CW696_02810 [ANME-2 cluster archaeon]|nr:MAG: hypothetical protein CW696_02810 [ANME-2 cluster archaeon]
MSDIDPELRDKIIETHTDMQNIKRMLEDGRETFRNHDARIRNLEQNQSKVMGIVVTVGSMITIVINGVLYLLGKIWK